jgi:hypothetical protein
LNDLSNARLHGCLPLAEVRASDIRHNTRILLSHELFTHSTQMRKLVIRLFEPSNDGESPVGGLARDYIIAGLVSFEADAT